MAALGKERNRESLDIDLASTVTITFPSVPIAKFKGASLTSGSNLTSRGRIFSFEGTGLHRYFYQPQQPERSRGLLKTGEMPVGNWFIHSAFFFISGVDFHEPEASFDQGKDPDPTAEPKHNRARAFETFPHGPTSPHSCLDGAVWYKIVRKSGNHIFAGWE